MFSKLALPFLIIIFLIQKTFAGGSIFSTDTLIDNSSKPKRIYTTTRLTTKKPVIDGKLNDECWRTGEWAGNYIQWIPNDGAKPSEPTQIKILYDDRNIYVAIRAFDNEPDKIVRKAGRRDEFKEI